MAEDSKNMRIIWQLGNILVNYRNKKAAFFNLTSVQMDVMVFLFKNRKNEEINQQDVQKYLMLTHPAVTGIIDRMEEKGFIKRLRSNRDGRYNYIELTEKGIQLEHTLVDTAQEAETIIMKNMTIDEQEQFERLLQIAMNNIKELK